MRSNGFEPEELLHLLGELLDGQLSESQRAELQEILMEHSEARGIYRQHMELHADLSFDYTGGLGAESMPGDPRVQTRRKAARFMTATLALAAMLLAALLIVGLLNFRSDQEFQTAFAENGLAVLSRALNVEWAGENSAFLEGDTLGNDRMKLLSGLVELEFFNGVSVIIEGPADLELVSEDLAICHEGRLRVFVPDPARGFTVSAPGFDAVDLGTEFAMSVEDGGLSEVHVMDGQVDLHGKDGSLLRNLHAGDAARQMGESESLESVPVQADKFVDWRRLSELDGEHSGNRYEEWKEYRDRWANDPETILYFDFEDHAPWERQLRGARAGQPNGGIVGAQWVTGRWPEKSALEFKRTTDRVRLDVPGQWEAISFAAWIRVEGLDQNNNALFLSDEWNGGEPHWQITKGGSLSLAINSIGRHRTKRIIGTSALGRWLHLGATYDPVKQQVSHYLNGDLVDSGKTNSKGPVFIGPAEIGNWKAHSAKATELRSFNGRMDELLILGRVMKPAEIREHYEVGNPYQ